MKQLRWYQAACLEAIWDKLDRHVVASVPTGGGKSLVIAELCRRALMEFPGTRICVLMPKRELIQQNHAELKALWPEAPIGIFCAGLGEKNLDDITMASIQSIYKHGPEKTGHYDLFIVDEAHLIRHREEQWDGMFHKLFDKHPEAKVVGLTATPYRLDGGYVHRGEGALFNELVYECDVSKLIEEGYLSPVISMPGSETADLSNVHKLGGEFKSDEMAEAFNEGITAAAVSDAATKLEGRRKTLVFVSCVEHGEKTAELLRKAGLGTVAEVYGDTPSQRRFEIVDEFKAGGIRFLVNCGVFTTGFNDPSVDSIILLRATMSTGLYVQMVGRGLRRAEGKTDCLILDYGGNVETHGPIDDVSINIDKSKRVWTCEECGTYQPYTKKGKPHYICDQCQWERKWTCQACGSKNRYPGEDCGECERRREKAKRDYESKLATQASQKRVVGHDPEEYAPQTNDVHGVSCKAMTSKKGDPMILTSYSVKSGLWQYFNIDKFILPFDEGYAGVKAKEFLCKIGVSITHEDTLDSIIGKIRGSIPKTITYKRNGKYWDITSYGF